MTDHDNQGEPTMEEILASIRRIISEDNDAPDAASTAGKPETPAGDAAAKTEVKTDAKTDTAARSASKSSAPTTEEKPAIGSGTGPASGKADSVSKDDKVLELSPAQMVRDDTADAAERRPNGLDTPAPEAASEAGKASGGGPAMFAPKREEPVFPIPRFAGASTPEEPVKAEAAVKPEPADTPARPAEPFKAAQSEHPSEPVKPAAESAGREPVKADRNEEAADEVEETLLSPEEATAAAAAFGALSKDVVVSNSGEVRSLEALVRDMMKPMLKEWLDENLPPLVEDVIEREVRRLSHRRVRR